MHAPSSAPNPAPLEALRPHLPQLDEAAWERIHALAALYRQWNQRVNLISRKDIDRLEAYHLPHCLSILTVADWVPGTPVVDVGTGGGLPGLVLAAARPQVAFTLLDSVRKKLVAAQEMADELGLANVQTVWSRAEDHAATYHFILGRAVSTLPTFVGWTRHLLGGPNRNTLANGYLYLKGEADLATELPQLHGYHHQVWALHQQLPIPALEGKALVYLRPRQAKPPRLSGTP